MGNNKIKKIVGGFNDNDRSNEAPKKPINEVAKEEPNKNTNVNTNETDNIEAIVEEFYKKQNEKQLKQDISGNYTLVVKHDLMERLDKLAEHYPRGFKSDLVNEALETFVSLYEKKPLPEKRKKRGRR
ncbi:hypothetical protein MOD91_18420 [Bacillus haynesii]|uniref:hypothetical protein n=1 Tax=Bacillus haynesii TaxID=1925021 RepID=UPI0022817BE1|nr:hypothetical protein [Bacillus haynesii]MCY8048422.1 hypothetical protein [Bacillus haynesii]MCY8668837.1 hypothetical protein [Bacillus haynesii]MCY9324023.1 hypothetical protein [Bacillus haynesii]